VPTYVRVNSITNLTTGANNHAASSLLHLRMQQHHGGKDEFSMHPELFASRNIRLTVTNAIVQKITYITFSVVPGYIDGAQ
jgi:hypothetical protein